MPGEKEGTVERTCLACGYNLYGLGDEPRCPECGLHNIPSAYRQQVWDLVDSGQWFFSGFFNPFKKRPPGWWWALDREGDLKRSYHVAARNIVLAIAIVLVSFAVADSIQLEVTLHLSSFERGRAGDTPLEEDLWRWTHGLGGYYREVDKVRLRKGFYGRTRTVTERQTTRTVFELSTDNTLYAAIACSWLVLTWAFPALIGLWTQIRKGLPDFARPPHSIRAAANYETHRLLFVSALIAVCLAMDVLMRVCQFSRNDPMSYFGCFFLGSTLVAIVGATVGWVGAIRSDYTQQLVRSKAHGIRIVVMYAALLPAAFLFALLGLVVTSKGAWGMWYYWIM